MTSLTNRMRTCAARIAAITDRTRNDASINDAVELLNEAAGILDGLVVPLPPAEPMEIMTPWVEDPLPSPPQTDLWIAPGGPLPGLKRSGTISPRACPKCDSRANKIVHRQGNILVLECPVCGHAWKRA